MGTRRVTGVVNESVLESWGDRVIVSDDEMESSESEEEWVERNTAAKISSMEGSMENGVGGRIGRVGVGGSRWGSESNIGISFGFRSHLARGGGR